LAAALAALGANGCRPAPYLLLVDPQEPLDPAALESCGPEEDIYGANEAGTCLELTGHYRICGEAIAGPDGDCVLDELGARHVVFWTLNDDLLATVGWSRCGPGERIVGLPRCTYP
jgi:hypothetical protein